ncbi:MAG: T9SS type A sorting domain-containing protein [Saprospiraceae bacterium]|nr:T9SS type A sorting domain-containing protein [Saprospiraceae bacterium]
MTMKFFLLCCLSLLPVSETYAQPGCPDPQALNYIASATSNDGSCQYPATNYVPTLKALLPDTLVEISGQVRAGANWYAHNDGSDGSRFYRFDPENGSIAQIIHLKQASNKDWEDIAASDTHIYIGDVGNNNNNRQDLGIYRIPLSKIGNTSFVSIETSDWSFIPFSYEDQTDFSFQPADSAVFDCEAMIVLSGKIHLFTKNRKEYTTTHYVVNQSNGKAEKLETFPCDGLITGADVSPDGKLIALLGYDLRNIPKVFAWLLWDWQAGSDLFFTGNKRRIELGSAFATGQAEGVGFLGNRTGYISNERTVAGGVTFVEQSTRWFDFGQWVPENVGSQEPSTASGFKVFPNPFVQSVRFDFFEHKKPHHIRVLNQSGQVVLHLNEVPEVLDMSTLPSGTYSFEAVWETYIQVFKALKM